MSRNAPNTRNRGIAAIADQIRTCGKRGMLQIEGNSFHLQPAPRAATPMRQISDFSAPNRSPHVTLCDASPRGRESGLMRAGNSPAGRESQYSAGLGISPSVQRPDSDVLVVSAMYCARSALVTDSTNTATPTEMSAPFGSFRTAIRKTDDSA